ncbi:type II secretion system protein M [Pseudomonas turukhanskensis]|uniref:Type II secretion system protein M n=1 Tax=Pseudomonas turukhanskensis TaxID=1806536 RepID=A0A9W6K7L8_9PSED|nr:type II secretion system protein M [Pseudomonas turukhanskensis]GLK88433.1 type II secretion system protein M [Pseudomonas turukhanskensis]
MNAAMLKNQLAERWQRSPLQQRWTTLVPRERMALMAMLVFLLGALLYISFWQPAQHRLHNAREALAQQLELSAYLQAKAPQARALVQRPTSTVAPEQLQGLITASAAAAQLTIERIDNQGAGSLQVNLQPVAFNLLLGWLKDLEGQGVRIDEAGLDRNEDGLVTSRLTLRVVQ